MSFFDTNGHDAAEQGRSTPKGDGDISMQAEEEVVQWCSTTDEEERRLPVDYDPDASNVRVGNDQLPEAEQRNNGEVLGRVNGRSTRKTAGRWLTRRYEDELFDAFGKMRLK